MHVSATARYQAPQSYPLPIPARTDNMHTRARSPTALPGPSSNPAEEERHDLMNPNAKTSVRPTFFGIYSHNDNPAFDITLLRPFLREAGNGLRQYLMLDRQNSVPQTLRRIIGVNRYAPLQVYRAVIVLGIDKMHRGAALGLPC